MFPLNLFLHRFRNELTHSLTNGNHFSSIDMSTSSSTKENYYVLAQEQTLQLQSPERSLHLTVPVYFIPTAAILAVDRN